MPSQPSLRRAASSSAFFQKPEVIQGAPLDHRADLYSFGAVAYEALCRHAPFAHHGDVMKMLRGHASEPAPPFAFWGVDEVPPALEAVILRLLEKTPSDRFQSCGSLAAALEVVAREIGVPLRHRP